MFDKFGRLLCPTCGEPMTRAAKFDSPPRGRGEDGVRL